MFEHKKEGLYVSINRRFVVGKKTLDMQIKLVLYIPTLLNKALRVLKHCIQSMLNPSIRLKFFN